MRIRIGYRSARCFGLLFALACVTAFGARGDIPNTWSTGYRPAMELGDYLKEFVGSAEKRENYDAVKALGDKYVEKLNLVTAGIESAGKDIADGDVRDKIQVALSAGKQAAARCRDRAEKFRDKGANKQNCLADAIELQKEMEQFSKDMDKGWQELKEYGAVLDERFQSSQGRWEDLAKSVSKDVEDLGRRANEAREKAKDQRAKANEYARIAQGAREQADKLRAELFSRDAKLAPSDVESKFDTYTKTAELVARAFAAQTDAEKTAADTDRQYADAQAAFQKAADEFLKKEGELNDLFKQVILHRKRLAYFRKEYPGN
jgi:hypothetical protein